MRYFKLIQLQLQFQLQLYLLIVLQYYRLLLAYLPNHTKLLGSQNWQLPCWCLKQVALVKLHRDWKLQTIYFLLLLNYKLKKFSHSLISKIILRTHKFQTIDCCVRLAWVHLGVLKWNLVVATVGLLLVHSQRNKEPSIFCSASDKLKMISQGISLFHTGHHCHSRTRLGWAGTTETFNSNTTAPEASLNLQGCHLTAVFLGVILTRGGSAVRVRHSTVFRSLLKSVVSGRSDASGVVALLWNIALHPPNQASFWNDNGDLCKKVKWDWRSQKWGPVSKILEYPFKLVFKGIFVTINLNLSCFVECMTL